MIKESNHDRWRRENYIPFPIDIRYLFQGITDLDLEIYSSFLKGASIAELSAVHDRPIRSISHRVDTIARRVKLQLSSELGRLLPPGIIDALRRRERITSIAQLQDLSYDQLKELKNIGSERAKIIREAFGHFDAPVPVKTNKRMLLSEQDLEILRCWFSAYMLGDEGIDPANQPNIEDVEALAKKLGLS